LKFARASKASVGAVTLPRQATVSLASSYSRDAEMHNGTGKGREDAPLGTLSWIVSRMPLPLDLSAEVKRPLRLPVWRCLTTVRAVGEQKPRGWT